MGLRLPWKLFFPALVLLLSFCAALLFPHPSSGIWRDHSILLLPKGSSESQALEALGSLGFQGISEATEPVQISSLSPAGARGGLETLSLSEALSRLGDQDPRRDAYLEGLPAWFTAREAGNEYRVIYVRGRPGSRAREAILKALGSKGIKASFPEALGLSRFDPGPALSLTVVLILLLLFSGRNRKTLVLGGLLFPFLALGLGGQDLSLAAIMAACLQASLLPGWDLLLSDFLASGWKTKGWRFFKGYLSLSLPFGLSLSILALCKPGLIPALVLCLLASPLGGLTVLAWRGAGKGRHPAFIPLPILGRKIPISNSGRLATSLASIVVLAVALSLFLRLVPGQGQDTMTAPPSLVLPQPSYAGPRASPDPTKALGLMAGKDELPNLADWLAHVWRQESLFFSVLGQEYPAFARLELPLAPEASHLSLVPDKAWARDAYRGIARESVEGLMLSKPGFSRMSLEPFRPSPAGSKGPLAPIEALLYIILMAPPMLGALFQRMGGFKKPPGATTAP